jgi:hypothetical protein
MQLTLRAATQEDIAPLAAKMRARDADEVKASLGLDPAAGLQYSLANSTLALTATDNDSGHPVAMLGVGEVMPSVGSPWLLGAEGLEAYRREFIVYTPLVIERFHEDYPALMNFVDARNDKAIRWLKRAGFKFSPAPTPYGVAQLPFYCFHKVRNV